MLIPCTSSFRIFFMGQNSFRSIDGLARRRGIYGTGTEPGRWRVFYQPVNRSQRIDGGILIAGFGEKKNHPLQFLEQMVLFSCFYRFFTESSLKIH